MDQEQETQIVRRAKQQAYRLLAYRNQTSSELRDRLQRRGYTPPVIDEVLRQLVSDGYVDDRKLALDWARYRLQTKPLGRRRLAWELRRRGIPPESVEEVLREVYAEFDEVTLAEQAARKRLGSKELPRSPRERQRYIRHLIRLGFDTEIVATALAALGSVDEAQDIISSGEAC
ncbi:MAG TPA: regulatory protein RecX [Candidatus Tectomicrobia bacterium]